MSNNIPYSAQELQNKFICCFKVISDPQRLDAVRYSSGKRSGKPYLYDSVIEAKSDRYFDPVWDEVIPAIEFFERIKLQKST